MTGWLPDTKCPDCRRRPNIVFSEREVSRAKLDRQTANAMSVRCTRCSGNFWITIGDIARAVQQLNGQLVSLLDPGTVKALELAGLMDEAKLRELVDDGALGKVSGIGPRRAAEIRVALDPRARRAQPVVRRGSPGTTG